MFLSVFRVSLETIDHILSVITSDVNTQGVAYGVTTAQVCLHLAITFLDTLTYPYFFFN